MDDQKAEWMEVYTLYQQLTWEQKVAFVAWLRAKLKECGGNG